jgi:hypothetical protein
MFLHCKSGCFRTLSSCRRRWRHGDKGRGSAAHTRSALRHRCTPSRHRLRTHRSNSRRVSNTARMTPNGLRATAPTPPSDVTNRNFSHSALLISEGMSALAPALSNARSNRSARSLRRLCGSPNLMKFPDPTGSCPRKSRVRARARVMGS